MATGKHGEDIAVEFILGKSYQLIERNWRHKHAEVDIIASKDQVLHFFEVKTRRGKQIVDPETSVNTRKLNKLKEAAAEFLYLHPHWKHLQFNIISIRIAEDDETEILLIEDVF